jgi:hypothetical protein
MKYKLKVYKKEDKCAVCGRHIACSDFTITCQFSGVDANATICPGCISNIIPRKNYESFGLVTS